MITSDSLFFAAPYMVAAGLELGSEVIITPLTLCATVNPILHAGLTLVLAGVEALQARHRSRRNRGAITSRTRANNLPLRFAGPPCDINRIMVIARKHDRMVIACCAHAIDAKYHGSSGCIAAYPIIACPLAMRH